MNYKTLIKGFKLLSLMIYILNFTRASSTRGRNRQHRNTQAATKLLSLTTTYELRSGQNGCMFDIVALKDLTVVDMDIHLLSKQQERYIEVYTRSGTFVDHEKSSDGWNLMGCTSVNGTGPYQPTSLLPGGMRDVRVNTGSTQAFYVTATDISVYIGYAPGTEVGRVYSQNSDMRILEGIGISYPFGDIFKPRVWNGTVYYVAGHSTSRRLQNAAKLDECMPSNAPSVSPTNTPSIGPSSIPSSIPSASPTTKPSLFPSSSPSVHPTFTPTNKPSNPLSTGPSFQPSPFSSESPSIRPSRFITFTPSLSPSSMPISSLSLNPSDKPSDHPSIYPSPQSSNKPSGLASYYPSKSPFSLPSLAPTKHPSSFPSFVPKLETSIKTKHPSDRPSSFPSFAPTLIPSTLPSLFPSTLPSKITSAYPSIASSFVPTLTGTRSPSFAPSQIPSQKPSTKSSSLPPSTFSSVFGTFATPVVSAAVGAVSSAAASTSAAAATTGGTTTTLTSPQPRPQLDLADTCADLIPDSVTENERDDGDSVLSWTLRRDNNSSNVPPTTTATPSGPATGLGALYVKSAFQSYETNLVNRGVKNIISASSSSSEKRYATTNTTTTTPAVSVCSNASPVVNTNNKNRSQSSTDSILDPNMTVDEEQLMVSSVLDGTVVDDKHYSIIV